MLKKFTYTLFFVALAVVFGKAGTSFSSVPPQNRTGATGVTCVGCHGGAAVNSGGGSVSVTGLPSGSFTAGQPYNFSLTIAHGAADRSIWGFSIAARNAAGAAVGTFSSTNPNAALNGNELSHFNAATLAGSTYTYNNLTWTAPATPGPTENAVTFYYVGNAANGTGSSQGDFIYTGSSSSVLPITLASFTAKASGSLVRLNWQTASESNSSHFVIEKSADNQRFVETGKVNAAGTSAISRDYEYIDDKPAYFESATFYRLALVDKDGAKKYSSVVSVVVKATATFVKKLYPNPAKAGESMQVEIVSDKDQPLILELYSVTGTKIKQRIGTLKKGTNLVEVPVHKFTATGIYSLVVRMGTQTQQIPVYIQ